ncbi:hypothetical protein C8F04DRAFT_1177609 [Mycena alexandri]|uniref:Uncharacterized protein n=1 Tax=Mycena alexandri TaxID=1745969 RepID=A0AAD6XAN4_9AGAR|nr:hypothetical protein C8F04DRAFT_1177609 [Mycena alexandri]
MKNTSEEIQKLQLPTDNVDSILGFSFISDAIHHELRVFWYFTWRDWSMSVVPGMIEVVIQSLARSFIYFLLFIYNFDIANQINGVSEDRINKPDRPLSSGLVSLQGAYIRWYITTAVHLVLAAAWNVLPWAALWVFITIYTSFYGGDKHWTTKNLLFMQPGAWSRPLPRASGGGPFCSASFLESSPVYRICVTLRAIKSQGRRTLPILMGSNFRWIMPTIICAAPAICWRLEFLRHTHWLVGYCGVLLTLSMFYMAYRVVQGYSPKYHHKTYMILTYIYCGCIAVPMLFP